MNRHFTREDMKMANKHTKMCLTLSAIREMQTKTTRWVATAHRKD